MAFKEYKSKPVTRKAHKVTDADFISKVDGVESCFELFMDDLRVSEQSRLSQGIIFKAYEPVNTGDYIVYLNADDIYHCNAEVFAERNILD